MLQERLGKVADGEIPHIAQLIFIYMTGRWCAFPACHPENRPPQKKSFNNEADDNGKQLIHTASSRGSSQLQEWKNKQRGWMDAGMGSVQKEQETCRVLGSKE